MIPHYRTTVFIKYSFFKPSFRFIFFPWIRFYILRTGNTIAGFVISSQKSWILKVKILRYPGLMSNFTKNHICYRRTKPHVLQMKLQMNVLKFSVRWSTQSCKRGEGGGWVWLPCGLKSLKEIDRLLLLLF